MKHLLYILTLCILFTACERHGGDIQPDVADVSLYAEYKMISWEKGDSISVFDGQSNLLYTASIQGDTSEFVSESKLEPIDDLYALYPYDNSAVRTDYGLDLHFPSVQKVRYPGFDSTACVAVAYVSDLQGKTLFQFKELCSYFNFSLKGEYGVVKVRLSGGEGEYLAGNIDVAFSKGEPQITVYEGIDSVTLYSDSVMEGTYQICVLPSVLQDGLTVTFFNSEGKEAEKRVVSVNVDGYESALVFVRGRANRIPIAFENPFEMEPETPKPEKPENPEPENPEPENPEPENPEPENPDPETPEPENPNPETPEPENPKPETPEPENPEPEKPSDLSPETEDYIYEDVVDLWN